jgi:hypothetical protein
MDNCLHCWEAEGHKREALKRGAGHLCSKHQLCEPAQGAFVARPGDHAAARAIFNIEGASVVGFLKPEKAAQLSGIAGRPFNVARIRSRC